MFALAIAGVALFCVIVALMLLLGWLRYIDNCAGAVFTTSVFPERGPIGGLLNALPIAALLVFVGGLGLVVYWIGVSGILWIGSILLFALDALFVWLAVSPKAEKNRDVSRFKANRPLLNWNLFGGLLPFIAFSVASFKVGLVPSCVNIWLYGICLVECLVAYVCVVFIECYESDPSKRDWGKARTSVKLGFRNLVFALLLTFVLLLIAVGMAPTVNTYLHCVSGAEGEVVGWGTELFGLVAAVAVCSVTIPFFPLWVPFYCWGFDMGVAVLLLELPMLVLLIGCAPKPCSDESKKE